jgi:hypothetical protein
LYVIVRGDIFIDPSVTELSGNYIALSNGVSGGTIYTCSENGAVPSPAYIANNCANRLVVYGTFTANRVRLLRVIDSLRDSLPGERPAGWGGGATSRAAEVFIGGPETWTVPPGSSLTDSRADYDAINNLPPVL